MSDYTITTVYYDGQFWVALIEKQIGDKYYTGKYTFGSEPSNPELLHFMLYAYTSVKILAVNRPVKIRIKKENTQSHSIKKSLDAFKEAQKEYFLEKSIQTSKQKKIIKATKYEKAKLKKKEQKRH